MNFPSGFFHPGVWCSRKNTDLRQANLSILDLKSLKTAVTVVKSLVRYSVSIN